MGRKVINKTGEEKVNSFGSKMVIVGYRNNMDIDVYFPKYNWTFEHTQYSNFKNGTIKCPYEPRIYGVGYISEGKYKVSENGKNTDEYNIYEDGEVSVCVISNGEVDSEVDVNLKALGFNTVEELVVDLLNDGYKFNL